MFIGNTEIRTPSDYPWAFDPCWRHSLAKAMLRNQASLPRDLVCDETVIQQRSYLMYANSPRFESYVSMSLHSSFIPGLGTRSVIHANRLYGSTGHGTNKERIEALLLCPEMSYSQIAKGFAMDPEDIRTYQALFFNCRNSDGELSLPIGLLQFFATRNAPEPTTAADYAMNWRQRAFREGSRGLFRQWEWAYDKNNVDNFTEVEMWSDLMPLIYRRLEERLRLNQGLDGRALSDVAGLVHQALADLRKDGIVDAEAGIGPDTAVMQILQLSGPALSAITSRSKEHRQKELETTRERLKKTGKDDQVDAAHESISRQLTSIMATNNK